MWTQLYREAGCKEAVRACRLSRGSQDRSGGVGDTPGEMDRELFVDLLRRNRRTVGDPHSVGLRQVDFRIGVYAPLYRWK